MSRSPLPAMQRQLVACSIMLSVVACTGYGSKALCEFFDKWHVDRHSDHSTTPGHMPNFVVNVGLFGNGEVALKHFLNRAISKYYPQQAAAGNSVCSGDLNPPRAAVGGHLQPTASTVPDLVARAIQTGDTNLMPMLQEHGCSALSYLGSVCTKGSDTGGLPVPQCAAEAADMRLGQLHHFVALEERIPNVRFVLMQR